ncbi:MAG: AAA family ATPase, partial [Tepidiformaceae bacterium]
MIPKKMRLRNFLSYKECTVDFTGVQLAVLCGRNGDGKSALMDGITWALWGKCRGAREDERIHLQEQEMLVDLEFEVAGDIFKVVRKRTRGRASGALEFFQRADDGSRIPLTGGTIAETEREIVRRVRLDYDTFVNSAFIAQGRSNEFTNKTPAERKVVFGKVLGLERYEQLAGAANDRKKDRTLQAAARERETEEARKELDQLPGVEQELARVTEEGAVMAPRVDELDKAVAELRQAAAAYRALELRLGEAEKRSQTAIRAHTKTELRRASP